jgi:hypothetical protein
MNDQDPSAPSENRLSEPESSLTPRGISPGTSGARTGGNRQSRQPTTEPKQLKIVVRIAPAEAQPSEAPKPVAEVTAPPVLNPPPSQDASLQTPSAPEISERKLRAEAEPQQIPARMLNEFVYCQRLFYYEFVEGVFVESVDTVRGGAIHQRVDSGSGALPKAKGKSKADKPKEVEETKTDTAAESPNKEP